MTGSSASAPSDYHKLYQQVTAVIDFARPLADRLLASGSLEGALKEGQKMALEGLLQGYTQTAQATIQREAASDSKTRSTVETLAAEDRGTRGMSAGSAPAHTPLSPLGQVGQLAGLASAGPGVIYAKLGVEGFRVASELARDYVHVVQTETTKRQEITAHRDIRVTQLQLARETMEQYLKATFDERRSNFGELFKRLDVAQERGDVQGMQLVLAGILDLAKSSPFKDLATFKQSLDNPDFVLEL